MICRLMVATAVLSGPGFACRAAQVDIYTGYYSREQNDGALAQASRQSQYIKFYPENRIVSLFIPYPYSKSVSSKVIRQVFDIAASKTSGSAYLSDTFGLLEQRVVVQLDRLHLIEDGYYFDCGVAVPCRIEFGEGQMRIIKQGLVKESATVYELIQD